jgi:hypothetical protein
MQEAAAKQTVEPVLTENDLAQFIGTEHHYKHPLSGLTYTDGVQYLAQKGKAYWLIDVVASYQGKLRRKGIPFQVWTLTAKDKHNAVLVCREDSNTPVIIRQVIGYTDFPLDEIKLYLTDNVLMLPSEY